MGIQTDYSTEQDKMMKIAVIVFGLCAVALAAPSHYGYNDDENNDGVPDSRDANRDGKVDSYGYGHNSHHGHSYGHDNHHGHGYGHDSHHGHGYGHDSHHGHDNHHGHNSHRHGYTQNSYNGHHGNQNSYN